MKEYPNQPGSLESVKTEDMGSIRDFIRDVVKETLEEDLPDCKANEWFIKSVHFANMLDRIMREIWVNV